MLLVVESGSSKSQWSGIDGNSGKSIHFQTDGINPDVHTAGEIAEVISAGKKVLNRNLSDCTVFFYGAGVRSEDNVIKVSSVFKANGFRKERIHIYHDLLGTARALFGSESGIACILGTGSSSGFYKSGEIKQQVISLGYILGDEGGGVDLGRKLLVEVLKGFAPAGIIEKFRETYRLTGPEILDTVFGKPRPNKFIASFAPFLSSHINNDYCRELVLESFRRFIDLNVMRYAQCLDCETGFTGSVAEAFSELLREAVLERDLKMGPILKSPSEKLMAFHLANTNE